MLRSMFGQTPRQDSGLLLNTNDAIDAFCKRLRQDHDCTKGLQSKWIRLDLWSRGLRNALNELEQSVYCSEQFGANITKLTEEDMNSDERADYYRYMYFYKNSIVRIFSTLDKTGYFLDKHYDLETVRIKQKFSYFTVLRELRKIPRYAALEQVLFDIKVSHQKPMERLRRSRNLEIHTLNVELIDDIWRTRDCFAVEHSVEPAANDLKELQLGFTMVCESLHAIFTACSKPQQQ